MTVITMTREMGSLGNRVSQEVSKRLGLRLVYQELVQSVAERMQMRPSSVGRFVEGESNFMEAFFVDSRRLGFCTAEELLELATKGDVLIRGWGASHVLKRVPHAMHVRVCAPIERRVEHMLKRMETLDSTHWLREIEASDRQHSGVLERMYGTNSWQDPAHYHLVLDTSVSSVEECTERIVEMSREPRFCPSDASRDAVADCLLAAQIKSRLQSAPGMRDTRLEVTACGGSVSLEGLVETDVKRELAMKTARAVEGVRHVENRLRVMREASNYMTD